MVDEIRIPDIEVIVGCAGNDIGAFCFYLRDDIHQGYEVVCAVTSQNESAVIVQILQDAITALRTADWISMDVLREESSEGQDDPPF